ncbi:hypothetical protein EAG_00738 [Camponotus floridanus]|uniref:Uncharacterized protein n=1 Tax=Camponotus floridanus TaxID=104421 RepID=E2AHF8_CAMFO|nr:hypothetical protein EAG_00738 [Camponotus floridanus]
MYMAIAPRETPCPSTVRRASRPVANQADVFRVILAFSELIRERPYLAPNFEISRRPLLRRGTRNNRRVPKRSQLDQIKRYRTSLKEWRVATEKLLTPDGKEPRKGSRQPGATSENAALRAAGIIRISADPAVAEAARWPRYELIAGTIPTGLPLVTARRTIADILIPSITAVLITNNSSGICVCRDPATSRLTRHSKAFLRDFFYRATRDTAVITHECRPVAAGKFAHNQTLNISPPFVMQGNVLGCLTRSCITCLCICKHAVGT